MPATGRGRAGTPGGRSGGVQESGGGRACGGMGAREKAAPEDRIRFQEGEGGLTFAEFPAGRIIRRSSSQQGAIRGGRPGI